MSVFRKKADMFVAYPKRVLAFYTDLTMPKIDVRKYDEPTCMRRANVAKIRIERAKRQRA